MPTPTTKIELVEGWTDPLDFYLLDDESTPSGTLAGTVEFIMKDVDGTQVDFAGDAAILSAADWTVRLTPDAADFVAGSYRARFKVTDGGGLIAFFPQGQWLNVIVREA